MSDPTRAADAAFDEAFDTASSETPAPEATPAETAAPAEAPSGQPRDAAGRFAAREAVPTTEPTETPSPETPPATEGTPEVPPEPEPQYPVYTYRAYGREYELPGSKVGEDGLFVPKDALPYLTQRLAEGHANREAARDFGRKLADAKREGAQLNAQAQALLADLAAIARDPDRMAEWGLDLNRNWDLLQARAERTVLQEQLKAEQGRLSEYEEEQQAAALVPHLEHALRSSLAEYGAREEFKGVDTTAMYGRLLHQFFDRIFSEATEEDVAQGIAREVGQIVVDYGVIEDEMRYEAAVLRRAQGGQQKIAEAAARNAKVTAPAKTPPTVGAKAGPAPKGAPVQPAFKSTKEVDEWFEGGGYNDL